MARQLSVHFEKVEPKEAVDLINADPNTEWVYIVNPSTHNHFPGKIVVGRLQFENEDWFISRGTWGAEEWWRQHGPSLLSCQYITWWVSCNEPVGNGTWTIINAYVLRWTQIAHTYNKKVIAFNFAVGAFPAGDKGGDQEKVNQLLPAIKLADAMGFHAYWLPEHWNPEHNWARTMLIWRYKEFMKLARCDKSIFITECGCDGLTAETLGRPNEEKGWTVYYNEEDYLKSLREFQAGLGERVVAAFVFDMGAWPRWKSYELTLSLIRGIMKYNQPQEGDSQFDDSQNVNGGVEMEQPIRVYYGGAIHTIEMEDYLKAVVPSEVYPDWPANVLEAQAICARSYAMAAIKSSKHHNNGYDVCSNQCCQVYRPALLHNTTSVAVDNTKGIVGVTSGSVAKMFFSSSCGGSTLDHWAPSYLRIVGCPCGPHKEVNGHRQGMCQWGAYYCVKDWNLETWRQILDHYFNLEYRYDYGRGELVFPNGNDKPNTSFEDRLIEVESHVTRITNVLEKTVNRLVEVEFLVNLSLDRLDGLAKWIESFSK